MRESGGQGPRTYTFLYTDIVGSSRLWEADPIAMAAVLEAHNELITRAVEDHNGRVFKSLGDGLACVFDAADAAVRSAVQIQVQFQSAGSRAPLTVRIGVHSGTAHPVGNDFGGPVLNRVSRITDLAESGQIYVSESARSLALDYVGESIRFQLLGEIGLEGMARPERIYGVIAPGLTALSQLSQLSELPPSNLEPLDQPFIGRARERADLVHRLTGTEQRLITIAGFGGMGKTTLARRCGLDVADVFEGKVYWIECESLNSREDLAAATLMALGGAADDQSVETEIRELVKEQKVLLIFDCFERIVTLSGFLDAQLRRCPGLRIVVTSRIVLGCNSEYLVELGGMSGRPSAGVESDAVALLTNHVSRHTPSFGSSKSDRVAARRLVQALEFVPLAIVICAGRLRYVSIVELLGQVRSSLLTAVHSPRESEGRHAGLSQVIQLSYELLDTRERSVLEALSVFEGGFTIAAALNVLNPLMGAVDPSLHILRDHCLIFTDREGRWRLLDSVREFAAARLAESELPGLCESHCQWALLVAQKIRDSLDRNEWTHARNMYRAEAPNLRAAIHWTVNEGKYRLDFGLAMALMFLETGSYSELERLGYAALEEARGSGALKSEIELLGILAVGQRRVGLLNLSAESLSRRADLCERLGDARLLADTICDLIVLHLETDDLDSAQDLITKCEELGDRAGENQHFIIALHSLVCARTGQSEKAIALAKKVEALTESVPGLLLATYRWLIVALSEVNELTEARRLGVAFARKALERGSATAMGVSLLELAIVDLRTGNERAFVETMARLALIPDRLMPGLNRRVRDTRNSLSNQQLSQVENARKTLGLIPWQDAVQEYVTSL